MWLIDKVFRKSGNRDRKDAQTWPAGFINEDSPYDHQHHDASYSFTQYPNAEFANSHGLPHVLPLLCNCNFFGISQIHGPLDPSGHLRKQRRLRLSGRGQRESHGRGI